MKKISETINLALNLFNKGQKEKAINIIDLLIKNNEENTDLLIIHAKMNNGVNNIDKANNSLLKVLEYQPSNIQALKLIYVNYLRDSKYDLATKYINILLNLKTNDYELFRDKAFIEYLNKNYKTSKSFIDEALKLNKEEVFGLNVAGLLHVENGDTLKAINYFKKAISINKNYIDSFNNLGKCYIDLEELDKAYFYFKKAFRLNTKSYLPLMNIANILSLKDKNKLAIRFYKKILELEPNNQVVRENIAICNCRLKNFDWVEKKYKDQLNVGNVNHNLVLGYSYLLLNKKRFSEAFNLFDARLKTDSLKKKNIHHSNIYEKLIISGKLEKDEKLLIVKEGGVGDEILFSSMYNNLIENDFSEVKIECDIRLLEIFKRSFNKNIFFPFGYFSSSKTKSDEFDKIIYSGSLTKYFRQNEKDFKIKPYLKTLKSLDDKFSLELSNFSKKKKIGFSWRSVINIFGGLKSLKISDFEKLFSYNRLFVNLQYGDTSDEIAKFEKYGKEIYNFKKIDLFNDFDSLISILKSLDIFVTVSNSTAHFAGALGVKTILVCPKKSSTYYYWDYEDGRTPWYPSISIVKFTNSVDYTMNLINDLIEESL